MTPEYPETDTVAVGVQTNGNARAEVDTLYTPLDEALAQLHQRRANANLRATVAEFHSAKPPTFLRNEPCAFFVRYIVSPNREFEHFVSTVRASGLPPYCIEFTEDIFSSRNPDKCRLSCPVFEVRPNHFARLRILSSKAERQRLCDLLVTNGMTLPAFHCDLLQQAFPEFEHHFHDFSEWFSTGCHEQHYYLRYLALFICDGILFENLLAADPEELRFARARACCPASPQPLRPSASDRLSSRSYPARRNVTNAGVLIAAICMTSPKGFCMKSGKRPKLEIRETTRYGKEVFAAEDIEKGRIVWVLDGGRMDILDLVEAVNSDTENIDDPLQIGKRTYIDLDEASRSFNHSCNPSAGVRKISEIFALRDIKEGEEITFDYSSSIAPTEWKMKCKCGSTNWRNIVGDVLSVPTKQLVYYKNVGALQKYMKSLLKEMESGKYLIPKYELLALENLKHTSEEIF